MSDKKFIINIPNTPAVVKPQNIEFDWFNKYSTSDLEKIKSILFDWELELFGHIHLYHTSIFQSNLKRHKIFEKNKDYFIQDLMTSHPLTHFDILCDFHYDVQLNQATLQPIQSTINELITEYMFLDNVSNAIFKSWIGDSLTDIEHDSYHEFQSKLWRLLLNH